MGDVLVLAVLALPLVGIWLLIRGSSAGPSLPLR